MVEVGFVKYKLGLFVERFQKCRLFGRGTVVLLLLLIAASALMTQLPGLSSPRINETKVLQLGKIDRSKLRAALQLKLAQRNRTGAAKLSTNLSYSVQDKIKIPSDKNPFIDTLHRESEKEHVSADDGIPDGTSSFHREPGANNAGNPAASLSDSQKGRNVSEVNQTAIAEGNYTEKTGEGNLSVQTNDNSGRDALVLKYDFEQARNGTLLPLPPNNASFVYYRCGEECQSQGTVDRLRGVLHSYLLSVALDRYFALDINFPCFENILQENEIPWLQSRKLADKLSNTSEVFWKFNMGDGDIFGEDAPSKKASGNRVLRTSQNAMAFYGIAANSKIGYRILKELKVQKPEEVNYESTARTVFWRLFSLTPKAGKVLNSIFSESGVDKDTGLVCAHLRTASVSYHRGELQGLMRSMQEKAGAFKKAIYFIASDDDSAYNAMKMFCKNCHFLPSPEGALQHVVMRGDKQCSAVERAVLELILLSHCDVYYMTLHSGFSMLPRFIRANRTQEASYIDREYIGV